MIPDRITELAKKYVEYDMISTHTELPEFPVPRVRLLYTFLKHREHAASRSAEACSLAAFLVQLGLDTHDRIDVGDTRKEEKAMRSRQLKVLAGDYFSSVFYELLAQKEEIGTVSRMSAAICEVNRIKVRLYNGLKIMLLSAEEYLKECVQLKMPLFLSFSHQLDKSAQNVWRLLLAELSRCEVMLDELNYCAEPPEERRGFAYLHIWENGTSEDKEMISARKIGERDWNLLLAKYKIKEQLASMLRQSVERVQSLVPECKGDKIRSEITGILEPMIAVLSSHRRAIQEG
ncbi:heptaprenyl diphosphate synthase [Fontibacillus phaseoli]|uniref:Heptaprenyl diphosphate synthase n=1 Tax=Fontibacillus phaseoli TaxID=1416533 RepID=A0A369BNS1_9BACL|nr:heptaprenyl diphosphate synthase component 1 [Fontibacillus phaseoli]RCX23252.1 heptaprenyl diphosphate synthase [Fontibacillus phaseoli]